MNTDSQPKKSLSHKKRLTKTDEIASKLISNDWNPFERANPKILEKIHKQKRTAEYEDALL